MIDLPRGRCGIFSCYFIKQWVCVCVCVCVCAEWCYCLNKAQFSQDCLAKTAQRHHRPFSRRLDRCDRMIQNEYRDSNGGNVPLFTAATCTSQCKVCSLRTHARLPGLLYAFREYALNIGLYRDSACEEYCLFHLCPWVFIATFGSLRSRHPERV